MVEVENLKIAIDIIGDFESELNQLLFKLGEVKTAIESVDGSNIDLDTRKAHQSLAALQAQMAMMNLGDGNLGSVGRRGGALRAGGAMGDAASEASEGLLSMDIRMEDLHNALAKLVPLILVIIGALPALIGGLVAVAGAAFAAAAALSALTAFAAFGAARARGGNFMDGMQDIFEDVQEDFVDAFAPLADRLAPLFEDALDGLDRLFQQIANEGDALVALTEEARAFGDWVLNTLPSFLGDVARFAEATSEALGVIVDGLGNVDIFGVMADMLAETLPHLIQFGALIVGMLSHIFEMSVGFLRVTNALMVFANILLDVITLGGMFNEEVGIIIAALLSAATATMVFSTVMSSSLIPSLAAVGTRVLALISTYTSYTASTVVSTAATYGLSTALLTLIGIATLGIGALAALGITSAAIGDKFGGMSSKIDDATDSLRDFQSQQNSMTGGDNPYRDPDLQPGQNLGTSRFSGSGGITVNVQGDADTETIRNQTQNANYRLERKQRRR